jgi:hypothetical protein
MSNWFNVYHQALLVRLAGLALIFGVLWPGLWLLFNMAVRLAQRCLHVIGQNARPQRGHP